MNRTLLLALFALAGCAAQPTLPRVQYHDSNEARQILIDRADRIKTVTAQGLLTLQRPDGQWVRLDLAMVRDNQKHIRLRAWKLGRAIFDFTMTPDGIWMLMPDDPELKNKVRQSQAPIAKVAETFDLVNGAFFANPSVKYRAAGHNIAWDLKTDDSLITCDVDSATLAPARYTVVDQGGVARFTLDLAKYRVLDGIPFATRYSATSEMGTIIIALDDVELNTELAPAAFTPPRRAEKVR